MLTIDSIDAFCAHLETHGASPNTVRAYRADLAGALAGIALDPLGWPACQTVLANYLTANRRSWAPKTTQRKLGAFRAWAAFAGAPAGFLASYRPPKPAPPQPHPIPEGIDGVLAMIRRTRNPKHRALCALTGLCGLRVGEAIEIRPSHFDLDAMTLTVRGKGDKTRVVPISTLAWRFLEKRVLAARTGDELLCPFTNRGGRAAITRHARNAGLSRHVSSHDMRATFATRAYQSGGDIRAVQELLGHSDVRTTQTYTNVDKAALRAAIEF